MNNTIILRILFNKSRQHNSAKLQLYGHLPLISQIIQVRPTRHVGYGWRSRNELMWRFGDIHQICADTAWWWERVKEIIAISTIRWLYIYIYIYIYIFTSLISTSIHGTRKKQKKNPGQEQEIKVSRITAQGKKKKIWVKKKEKANLVRPLEKKSKDTQSVVKRKPKNPPRILQCYNY